MTNNGEKTFFCSFLHSVMSSFTFTYQQVLHKLYYLCPEIIFFYEKTDYRGNESHQCN